MCVGIVEHMWRSRATVTGVILFVPIHGWTYDQRGSLIRVTDEGKFGQLDGGCRNLVEIYTREVAGLIFTCLTPGRVFDIEAFLGEMLDELASYHLETWSLVDQNIIEGPNWKVAVDGYVEFYHIDAMHRDTLAFMVTNNVMACDQFGEYPFGPHQRIAAPSADILQRLDKPVAEWSTGEAVLDVKFVFPEQLVCHYVWQCLIACRRDACHKCSQALCRKRQSRFRTIFINTFRRRAQ